ncbi:hypothetical protein ACFXTH_011855 [Malus domestica]
MNLSRTLCTPERPQEEEDTTGASLERIIYREGGAKSSPETLIPLPTTTTTPFRLGYNDERTIMPRVGVLQNDIDLLHPPAELEKRKHKLKRLVQTPNSFFMDVKCQGCFSITTVFSHSQTVVVCGNCQTVLCQPTGGRARLTEGCSFRRKGD